jgi:hypothetical protein
MALACFSPCDDAWYGIATERLIIVGLSYSAIVLFYTASEGQQELHRKQ